MNHSELGQALRAAAYLEGDFLLRSGKRSRYYLDKFRFETRPDLLAALGERIAAAAREHEPEAVRLAAPVLGAVPLAAAASLAGGMPFVIVRDEAKAYGTANRLEGAWEEGEIVCLVEDIVTSGGALVGAIAAVREAGLVVRTAVCVIDREEGGADALARHAVRLRPLFRAGDLLQGEKPPQNRMVERQTRSW
jgi:orotate phosphoribosyltransferase